MSRNACDGSSPILVCRVACHAELFAVLLLAVGAGRLPALVAELVAVVAGVKEGGASGIHTSD